MDLEMGLYTLRWNSLGEGITYKLREGEEEDGEITLSPQLTATIHSVTTAKRNGSYNYYVRACHTNGVCSDWSSDPLTVHVFTASAPTWVSEESISRDGSYTLRWAPVTDAATYELQEEVMSESNTPLSLTPEDVQNRISHMHKRQNGRKLQLSPAGLSFERRM